MQKRRARGEPGEGVPGGGGGGGGAPAASSAAQRRCAASRGWRRSTEVTVTSPAAPPSLTVSRRLPAWPCACITLCAPQHRTPGLNMTEMEEFCLWELTA